MRKVRLNPDQLRVESFPTVRDEREARGTVRGHDSWLDPASYSDDPRCVCPLLDSAPPPCTQYC